MLTPQQRAVADKLDVTFVRPLLMQDGERPETVNARLTDDDVEVAFELAGIRPDDDLESVKEDQWLRFIAHCKTMKVTRGLVNQGFFEEVPTDDGDVRYRVHLPPKRKS